MPAKESHSRKERKAKLFKEAHESLRDRIYKPLPLNNIKVGQVIFLKMTISEGPNDYSPGGIYGRRGDAVVVTEIVAYQDKDAPKSDDYCTVKYRYSVAHCDYEGDAGFVVDRWEVMPTDPLVTVNEQRDYLAYSYRYKTLDARFGNYEKPPEYV